MNTQKWTVIYSTLNDTLSNPQYCSFSIWVFLWIKWFLQIEEYFCCLVNWHLARPSINPWSFFSELPVCVYNIYYLTNYRPVQKYILLPPAHLYGNYWLTAVTWRPCSCIFYTQSVQNITHFEHYDIILRLFLRQVFSRNWNL